MTGQTSLDMLLSRGRDLQANTPENLQFSPEIRRRTENLRIYPHAYVFTSIFDRNIPTKKVEFATLGLWQRLGDFSFDAIRRLPLETIQKAMTQPTPLHRFHGQMASNIYQAIRLIESKYSGDAARIWSDEPTARTLIERFQEFPGIGPKISRMATLILLRDFHVRILDLRGFDVAPDVHVRRVLWRLGLAAENADDYQLINRGRELNPEFPGLLDLPLWEVGNKWCYATSPDCRSCYLRGACPTANHTDMAPTIPLIPQVSPRRPTLQREVRPESSRETGLQQFAPAVRPLAEKLIRAVKVILPTMEPEPTQDYLSLKCGRRLVVAIYPRNGGLGLGHYDPPQSKAWVERPVWREEDLAAVLPKILERARYLK